MRQKDAVALAGLEPQEEFWQYVPQEVGELKNPQTAIPRIAKDVNLAKIIDAAVQRIPTAHNLHLGDARRCSTLEPASVHLVLTSPPYWTLKRYRDGPGQMGHIGEYEVFLVELDTASSYKQRYEILLTKLVQEKLYDAACLLLSNAQTGAQGQYQEPSPLLSFQNFVDSLLGRAKAI